MGDARSHAVIAAKISTTVIAACCHLCLSLFCSVLKFGPDPPPPGPRPRPCVHENDVFLKRKKKVAPVHPRLLRWSWLLRPVGRASHLSLRFYLYFSINRKSGSDSPLGTPFPVCFVELHFAAWFVARRFGVFSFGRRGVTRLFASLARRETSGAWWHTRWALRARATRRGRRSSYGDLATPRHVVSKCAFHSHIPVHTRRKDGAQRLVESSRHTPHRTATTTHTHSRQEPVKNPQRKPKRRERTAVRGSRPSPSPSRKFEDAKKSGG